MSKERTLNEYRQEKTFGYVPPIQEESALVMDDFDKTLKVLHESTHDKKVREALLTVQEYKALYLDKNKDE